MDQKVLVAAMNSVAETLRYPIELVDSLERITGGAAETIPGVDHASISVTTKAGRIQTLAPTDPVAVSADALQYDLSEGPCLDAAVDEPLVQVEDLATDLRWPSYGPKAAADLDLRSQVAFQFRAEPHTRGALNLYSHQPHQIGAEARELGALFALLAAIALGWARQDETIVSAITNREQIGQAIGIVMERYRLGPDRAFAFLARTSQTGNVKLYDVAAAVIADTIRRAE